MMRPSLAIVVTLVGGCATEPDALDSRHTEATPGGLQDTNIVKRLVPEVCGARRWDTVHPASKNVDLAVVATKLGATVLTVDRVGGTLDGFTLDGRGLIMGNVQGTKIRSDFPFTSVAAGITDGRLVANLVSTDKRVHVTAISDDLSQQREIGVLDGNVSSDLPITHIRGERASAVGGAAGMLLTTFNKTWTQTAIEPFARDVPTSMTGAAFGEDTMVAWSTASTCTLQRVASNITSTQPAPCENPRLAASYAARNAEMMWEQGEHVLLTDIDLNQTNELASEHVLAKGSSPRIVFDGQRYWGSYLDTHGNVVVGYLNDKASLSSIALTDVTPQHDAYDLVVLENGVWVFAVDGAGFTAQKLCLTEY